MNEGDGVVAALGQFAADGLGVDRLAPFELERGGLLVVPQRDVVPLVGKRAAMQFKTLRDTRLRIAPSITPQALEVDR